MQINLLKFTIVGSIFILWNKNKSPCDLNSYVLNTRLVFPPHPNTISVLKLPQSNAFASWAMRIPVGLGRILTREWTPHPIKCTVCQWSTQSIRNTQFSKRPRESSGCKEHIVSLAGSSFVLREILASVFIPGSHTFSADKQSRLKCKICNFITSENKWNREEEWSTSVIKEFYFMRIIFLYCSKWQEYIQDICLLWEDVSPVAGPT